MGEARVTVGDSDLRGFVVVRKHRKASMSLSKVTEEDRAVTACSTKTWTKEPRRAPCPRCSPGDCITDLWTYMGFCIYVCIFDIGDRDRQEQSET